MEEINKLKNQLKENEISYKRKFEQCKIYNE